MRVTRLQEIAQAQLEETAAARAALAVDVEQAGSDIAALQGEIAKAEAANHTSRHSASDRFAAVKCAALYKLSALVVQLCGCLFSSYRLLSRTEGGTNSCQQTTLIGEMSMLLMVV